MKITVSVLVYANLLIFTACDNGRFLSKDSTDSIASAERIIGLNFTKSERDSMRDELKEFLNDYSQIRKMAPGNDIASALVFNHLPTGFTPVTDQDPIDWVLPVNVKLPERNEDLAFYSVSELSVLMRRRKITSVELTNLFLDRLKQYGDTLECVITLTEELALRQAAKADKEIAEGRYRGPLHGIPYGAKDILSVKGYKTTWGAEPFKNQELDVTATVIKKLEEAGAVLVAKLTLGELAWGDIWYGGKTRNPWDLTQGSSGSSAGSASATTAGLVPFAMGTETWGSIVSPATRCGATGLRPTFGRISRHGAMALSWSMDKIGPICRSAQDCALVFNAIRGRDNIDRSVIEAAFNYQPLESLEGLNIGYIKSLFDREYGNHKNDSISLEIIKQLGGDLNPIDLPDTIPLDAMGIILSAEAGAAFDELTRSDLDSLLRRQGKNAWPNVFRSARLIPAVEYIQANRLRKQIIDQVHTVFSEFDVILTPSFGGNQLLLTNLTGHPCVVLPNGFDENGSPTSITFLGNLFEEAKILAVARLFQKHTYHEDQHPEFFN